MVERIYRQFMYENQISFAERHDMLSSRSSLMKSVQIYRCPNKIEPAWE